MHRQSPRSAFQASAVFGDACQRDAAFRNTDFAHGDSEQILCLAMGKKYVKVANDNPNVSCVVTLPELAGELRSDVGVVVADQPDQVFYTAHNQLFDVGGFRIAFPDFADPSAEIHPTAVIEPGCWIGANVVIGAQAVIHTGTLIEDDVTIGAGALIGIEGHFTKRFEGRAVPVRHAGGVRIGKASTVAAGGLVQRALHQTMTEIGTQTFLAPAVHISHGVRVGDHCTIAGSSQIAGYTTIGNEVWIGPSCVVGNLLTVGDRSRIEIGSVVVKSLAEGSRVSGFFAGPHTKMLRIQSGLMS